VGHDVMLVTPVCHSVFTMRCTTVQSIVLLSRYHLSSVCPSICPSVCDVGGSGPHKWKILETNCTNNYPNIFALS